MGNQIDEGKLRPHRVMRLVLPTLWSPSNTIFVRFNVPDGTSVVGDVGLAMSCVIYGREEEGGGFRCDGYYCTER
jgi:hypothetical protein